MEVVKEKAQVQKYPTYKDSGLEWLGEIPEHWDLRRFKYLFKELNERSSDGTEDLLSVSQYTGVTRKGDKVEEGDLLTNASTLEGYKKVRKGDLVTNIMLAWNGSLGFSPFEGITSPAYSIYRLQRNNEERFFHYLLRTDRYKSEFKRNSSGVIESRLRLYSDDFFRILSLLPPVEEQTAIANFLDEKCGKIDTAIAQKQKLIELLKERKQILIQNAVTKGLDPNVKMKDSGVEWIGEIPEHWEVNRLKNFIDLLTGFPFKSEKYTDKGIKLARGINVKEGVFNWKETRFWPSINKELRNYKLRGGDVLIGMDGSKVGKNFCQVQERDLPILLVQRVARLRTEHELNPNFLFDQIRNKNFLAWVEMSKTDPMVPHIAPKDIKNFIITVPPIEEQESISEFVRNKFDKIDTALDQQKKQIKKLKEYKSSLIDAAVTGKIKVTKD